MNECQCDTDGDGNCGRPACPVCAEARVTSREIELMRHAVGWPRNYRNHYAIQPDSAAVTEAGQKLIAAEPETEYRCLSVMQPWATLIGSGVKTIEVRSRRTLYRGPLLIHATKKSIIPNGVLPSGVILCIVDLVDCRPMTPEDVTAACYPWQAGKWAWMLANARMIDPIPLRGQQGLFRVRTRWVEKRLTT